MLIVIVQAHGLFPMWHLPLERPSISSVCPWPLESSNVVPLECFLMPVSDAVLARRSLVQLLRPWPVHRDHTRSASARAAARAPALAGVPCRRAGWQPGGCGRVCGQGRAAARGGRLAGRRAGGRADARAVGLAGARASGRQVDGRYTGTTRGPLRPRKSAVPLPKFIPRANPVLTAGCVRTLPLPPLES